MAWELSTGYTHILNKICSSTVYIKYMMSMRITFSPSSAPHSHWSHPASYSGQSWGGPQCSDSHCVYHWMTACAGTAPVHGLPLHRSYREIHMCETSLRGLGLPVCQRDMFIPYTELRPWGWDYTEVHVHCYWATHTHVCVMLVCVYCSVCLISWCVRYTYFTAWA